MLLKENSNRNRFPESIWIDYATPGLGITKLLQTQLEQSPPNLESGLTIFLQNHGDYFWHQEI